MKRNKRGKGIEKKCVFCKCMGGGGGDRHAKDHCPPAKNVGESGRARRRRLRKKRAKGGSLPQRGVAVAGIHNTPASGDKSKRSPKKLG